MTTQLTGVLAGSSHTNGYAGATLCRAPSSHIPGTHDLVQQKYAQRWYYLVMATKTKHQGSVLNFIHVRGWLRETIDVSSS